MISNNFIKRHNGPRCGEVKQMLEKMELPSIDELIESTVPSSIRLKQPLQLPEGMNEFEYLNYLKEIAKKNRIFKTYIGLGYYNTITPGVIQRNILENPGWYTSYTPYQAEISQGRLEALLNFQTAVSELTGLPLANASLLDEGTAASEAMIMAFNSRPRQKVKAEATVFLVADHVFPQTIDILKTRSEPLGITLKILKAEEFTFDEKVFGCLVQYPDQFGEIHDFKNLVDAAHAVEAVFCVAADIMSLALLTPPGEWGADVAVGSTQRFGIPMGYGGPHAAYFATREDFKRNIPGRIIGVSVDANGRKALRMALQTREQHIKRERATSNICTAQALLAIMAGMYTVYHGENGIRKIAEDIHYLTVYLAENAVKLGYKQHNTSWFDTLNIHVPDGVSMDQIRELALNHQVNFRYIDEKHIGISLDETTSKQDVDLILKILAAPLKMNPEITEPGKCSMIVESFKRTSRYLTDAIFNAFHSETELMRYITRLANRDLGLDRTMIPLGSCTMKLNAAAELFHLSWPEFGAIHPFVPEDQAKGYLQIISELGQDLCEITGFEAISFQPNSGAAGEYTGLMVIREYFKHHNQINRDVCLIPSSAHGTNPASAVMAGMKVVTVKTDEQGNIDIPDLKLKALQYRETLAALMVTYPSTHGVFEEGILEIMDIIHENGGLVYMDGANMNAQVGLTNPGTIGADVCHLNLHKTFAIPHGGGGPGMGPIAVNAKLKPYLPGHTLVKTGGEYPITAVAATPFGSAFILPISFGYIKMLGGEGLKKATEYAILNANYLRACLQDHYKILYTGSKGQVAHEMILDCNEFHKTADITPVDIAKRLMDYGFHAPTVAFPVHGTLMVEPTESEPLSELNRFVEAMISIRKEIAEIEEGKADKENNLLKKAPHTLEMTVVDDWNRPYTRQQAAFPVPMNIADKYWPSVTRIDDAYGDRNLVCTCQDFFEALKNNQ